MRVTIPKSWTSISIDQFPLIYDIIKDNDIEPIDKEIRLISIITGLPVATIEAIELGQLRDLIKKVRFIFKMEFPKAVEAFNYKGYKWHVNYDITKISAADFISLTKLTATEEDVMVNMAEVVSIFVKPYKRKWFKYVEVEMDYKDKLAIIKTIDVGTIYPVCVFFCKVLTNLLPVIVDYLEKEKQEILKKIAKEIELN
jgi:hypothetical protein